jgi:hypothetical protein
VDDNLPVADDTAHSLPDGIGEEHFDSGEGVRRHASVLSLLILGGILATALTGFLGGGFNERLTTENEHVVLTYDGPTVIRNGMFFEAHALILAKEPIDKLVLEVSEPLIHDMTMNSMVPAAAEETFEGGSFRFKFDRLEKGDTYDVKFDFQINPSLFAGNEGHNAVYDDKDLLAEVPVTIAVLP